MSTLWPSHTVLGPLAILEFLLEVPLTVLFVFHPLVIILIALHIIDPDGVYDLIKEEESFPMLMHLERDSISLEEEDDHSDLTLKAAKAKRKICQAQKHLADCILEHHEILTHLCHRHAEDANTHLLLADLNVGRLHLERRKDGIAAYIKT
ncbi:hypothetical protein EDD22DRAFT_856020 [Suillus occidentalis]|nr:hypothetical protein EDD22DRAFT_856020 [Suillus occidentalis]